MTDRLTDAALDEIEAAVGDLVPIDPSDLVALVAEVRDRRAARTMTTYRMADGSLIYGEFGFVTETEWFDGADPPAGVVRERWALVESETLMLPEKNSLTDAQREWIDSWDGLWLHVDTSPESVVGALSVFDGSRTPTDEPNDGESGPAGPLPGGSD